VTRKYLSLDDVFVCVFLACVSDFGVFALSSRWAFYVAFTTVLTYDYVLCVILLCTYLNHLTFDLRLETVLQPNAASGKQQ